MRKKKNTARLGLTAKLIASHMILIFITTIMFGIYFFNSVKTNILVNLKDTGQQTVQRVLADIDRNAEICETAAQIMLNDKVLLNYAQKLDTLTSRELLELRNGLLVDIGRIRNVNPDINRLCIYSAGANIIEAFPTIYSESRLNDQEVRETVIRQSGRNYWSLQHKDNPVQQPSIYVDDVTSLYREAVDINGRHVGIIEAGMLTNVFFNEVFANPIDMDSFICVTDSNENLIINKNNSMFKSLNIDFDQLKEQLVQYKNGDRGNFSIQLGEVPVFVMYGFTSRFNAYVYQVVSVASLTKSVTEARNQVLLGISAVLIVLSGITYLVTSALMKKIKIMRGYISEVQKGNISVSVPSLGNDEIGELARHFRKMMDRINELIAVTIENQQAITESELKAMNAQINSHFTYNTLDTIQMMAEVDEKYEIADAINYLGKLMRYSSSWRKPFTPLKDEIKHVQNYISLVNIKHDQIVELQVHAEDELLAADVPRILLQPIVENSIFHGFKPKGNQGKILIHVSQKDEDLIIEVIDNGRGIPRETLIPLQKSIARDAETSSSLDDNSSIGLLNVSARIKLYYGKDYGLEIESVYHRGTKIIIRLPHLGMGGQEDETGFAC